MVFDKLTFLVWWEFIQVLTLPFALIIIALMCDKILKRKRRKSSAQLVPPEASTNEIHSNNDSRPRRVYTPSGPSEAHRPDREPIQDVYAPHGHILQH